MGTFIWGLIFLFCDFNLGSISILPAWVGYLLLATATARIPQSKIFRDSQLLFKLAAVYTGILWLLGLAGIGHILFAVGGSVLQVWSTYRLTRGMAELETDTGRPMDTKRLMTRWWVLILSTFGGALLAAGLDWVAAILVIVVFVLYAAAFANSYKIWAAGEEQEKRST